MVKKGNATTTFEKPIRRHASKRRREENERYFANFTEFLCALKLCKNIVHVHLCVLVDRA